MVDPVRVQQVSVVGRLTAPDPKVERVFFTFNADFSAQANIIFDMSAINQKDVFGGPIRGLFMDNSSNPSEVTVYVQGTDQFFTIPAFAEGVFAVDANVNSIITFETEGGATDTVTITLYNWERAPAVWYKYGTSNKDIPQKVEGANPNGTADVDDTDFPNPMYLAGRTEDGTLVAVRVDADGRLSFDADIVLGNVGILDGDDVAEGATTDAAETDPAANATMVALSKGILSTVRAPRGSAITTPAMTVADAEILAANNNRKGALIINETTEICYIALDDVDSTVAYSYPLAPNEPLILDNGDYTGRIRGHLAAGAGNLRVTEFTLA